MDNPEIIKPVDLQRLPQHPVTRNGKKITRPIIVKLNSVSEKYSILNRLKQLKPFNQERRQRNTPTVYVTDHLPQLYQQQRKRLLPVFNEARSQNRKTSWRIINGEYCLFVDNVKVC